MQILTLLRLSQTLSRLFVKSWITTSTCLTWKQKQKDAKKKQHQVQVKEIKLRPATDVGDYQVKLRAILKFLEEGNKVKITLRFRGREMAHQQLGLAQLQKIEADVAEFGIVEQAPKMEGRQMGMLLGPKKKK